MPIRSSGKGLYSSSDLISVYGWSVNILFCFSFFESGQNLGFPPPSKTSQKTVALHTNKFL